VVGVSPADGLVDFPTNAKVLVEFDESVHATMIREVALTEGGVEVPVQRSLSNGNRRLTLTPLELLAPSVEHTVTVAGVEDLSGNALGAPVVTTFTTGTGVDIARPTVTVVDPPNEASNVSTTAVARIDFSERINPLTVTEDTFFIERTTSGIPKVPGTVTVAVDGLRATYTPDALLDPSTDYRVRTFSGITDLVGNTLTSTSIPSNFTTAP
jgi:hypothetical protein